jgi:hypothetical protein
MVIMIMSVITINQSIAQNKLTVGEKYLQQNGKPTFISGANYSPSTGWFQILDNWNPDAVAKDMDSLQSIGVNFIRFMPLWYLTQPEQDKFDQQKIDRLNELISIAGKRNIAVQPALITGWLDGGIFTPSWVKKDLFTNPDQIKATAKMVTTISKALSTNPNVHSYDFGNEINAMKGAGGFPGNTEEIKSWMATMYKAFKTGDPNRLVTNGIGTGYDDRFPIENISEASDYMSAHSYAYFHGTISDDPWFGLRSTYSPSMIVNWAKMAGKPVLMQETGISGDWVSQEQRAKFLEMEYFSCWANGAAGFVWWCSHNIDTAFRVKPHTDGRAFVKEGKFDALEYQMGLLDINNNKFPAANQFKECVEFSSKLELDWTDQLPVCYIVTPEIVSLNSYFRKIINAYILAKQNHVEVRFINENKEIPTDAAFVVVPGFSVKAENRKHIINYLTSGGTVYQSFYNNFAPTINLNQEVVYGLESPAEILVTKHVGDLNHLEKFNMTGHLKMSDENWSWNYETIMKSCPDCKNHSLNEKGKEVFYRVKVGKGTFYLTRLNVEESLCDTYNPWVTDESWKMYSILKPEQDIDIDSKFVEFFHKKKGTQEIIVLINHSNAYQETVVKSKRPIQLKNMRTNEEFDQSKEFSVRLKPAEVLFLTINR